MSDLVYTAHNCPSMRTTLHSYIILLPLALLGSLFRLHVLQVIFRTFKAFVTVFASKLRFRYYIFEQYIFAFRII